MRTLSLLALLVAGVAMIVVPAEAARRRAAPGWQQAPVVKDCTPLNGRYGYYGNPWCTQAEQDAWSRATSRKLR